jgi:4'-phosphopantetheinyl transferase
VGRGESHPFAATHSSVVNELVVTGDPQAPAVDVWYAHLDTAGLADSLRPLLSPDELQRADRFRFEKDHRRYVAARGLLRMLLGNYLDQEPAELAFNYAEAGKPSLIQPNSPNLHFNISHSENAGLYAFSSSCPVGADVEWIRSVVEINELAARYFSVAECAALQAVEPAGREAAFFRCWTRKEAFIKALGTGLGHPLNSFSVTVDRDDPVKIEWARDDARAREKWTLQHFDIEPGLIGAVAVPLADAVVRMRGDALHYVLS